MPDTLHLPGLTFGAQCRQILDIAHLLIHPAFAGPLYVTGAFGRYTVYRIGPRAPGSALLTVSWDCLHGWVFRDISCRKGCRR